MKIAGTIKAFLLVTALNCALQAQISIPSLATCGVADGHLLRRQAVSPSWTIGQKKLLYLRVRFAGDSQDPNSIAEAEADLLTANEDFKAISYGQYSLTWAITPVLELAQTADYYAERRYELLDDARNAARALGFDYELFDLEIVRHANISSWAGGYGNLGQRGSWIQTAGAYIIVHEIGHNLGLNHANFWDTSTPSTGPKISPPFPTNTNEGREGHEFDPGGLLGHDTITGLGSSIEYGDVMDVMGGGDTPTQFNAVNKFQLGWLTLEQRGVVRESGTFRLHAFDGQATVPENKYLLRVERPGFIQGSLNHYWIQYKGGPSIFPGIPEGVQIHTRQNGFDTDSSLLLDMTPGSEGRQTDATLPIGKTFSDSIGGVHITPLSRDESAQHIDVAVFVGEFPNNRPPALELQASSLSAEIGQPIQLTATAVDPDGDQLAYFWELQKDEPSVNSNQLEVAWKSPGDYVVRCEVSDLRGGIAIRHLVIRVGEMKTFRLSGRITTEEGLPVVGAWVHNGRLFRNADEGNHVFSFTDSNGSYTLANLQPGSYTNGAYLHGYRLDRSTTEPFVIVNADVTGADFRAAAIPTLTVETSSPVIEEGQGNTHFIFTRSGVTDQPLSVFFSLSGTAQVRSDYADYFFPRVVFPAGASSVTLPFSTFSDNTPEGDETISLIVHYPTETTRQIIENDRTIDVTYYYPGWELCPGPGTNFWTQTYPEFMPGKPATFTIEDVAGTPDYIVSVRAGDLIAIEDPLVESYFEISREGSVLNPLIVEFQLGGTATAGIDFQSVPASIIIPPGESSVRVPIIPIQDVLVEKEESIILTILPNKTYEIGIGEAAVPLRDNALVDLILGLKLLEDGRVNLSLEGQPGRSHVLEESTNLRDWVPFRTNILFNNRLEVTLPNSSTEKFFRALIQK